MRGHRSDIRGQASEIVLPNLINLDFTMAWKDRANSCKQAGKN